MKVKLEKDYRRLYTLEDHDCAKAVINSLKEDESPVTDWLDYAVGEWQKQHGGYAYYEIIRADARTAKNCRVWNAYGDDTGNMDVWIKGIAKSYDSIIEIGAYLSDIFQTGAVPYADHIYAVEYRRVED